MNRKKWNTIALISLIIIVLEVVSFFVFIKPAIGVNKVFKALEKCTTATEYMDYDETHVKEASAALSDLNNSGKKKVKKVMVDFINYECNQLSNDKITFDELDCICSSIEELKGYDGFTAEYLTDIYAAQSVKIFNEACKENLTNGNSSEFYDITQKIYDIYSDCDDSEKISDALKADLKTKYDAFLSGNTDYDTMNAYANVAYYCFEGSALDYAGDVVDGLYYVEKYSGYLDEAQKYIDEEDYFGAIEYIEDLYIDEDDTTGYYQKIQDLKTKAYDTGKTYYVEKAQNLIANGDVAGAREIISQIKEVYGDEVDTASVESSLKEPWMDSYVQFMTNWEETLKTDLASAKKLTDYDDISAINLDENKPTNIYLYDFDGNGTPELVLSDGTVNHVYGFDGTKVVYTGSMEIATFCKQPELITIPNAMPDGYTGYELIKFDNNEWSVVEYYVAANDGSKYIVDGSESTYEDCEAKHNDIAGHEDTSLADSSKGTSIDNYEEFIYSYGVEQ